MSYDPPINLRQVSSGAAAVSNESVLAQISPRQGLSSSLIFTTVVGVDASVSVVDDKFVCNSGTAADGFAAILTRRYIKYRSGQSISTRFTSIFGDTVEGQQIIAGLIDSSSGLGFSSIDGEFGVYYYYNGEPELQQLTITAPAGAAEVATVTIDGVGYPVNLTAGTVEENASDIALQLSGVVPGYLITSAGDEVTAQGVIPRPAGAFAFTSASATGSWTQITQGQVITQQFTPQASWSEDTASWLDSSKINAYQVVFSEDANLEFWVFDPDQGAYILVHLIKRLNATIETASSQPSFRGGWVARNITATVPTSVEGSACGIFNNGELIRAGRTTGLSHDQIDVDTTPTNIISVRSRISFAGSPNRAELLPVLISMCSQADKSAFIDIIINPTFVTQPQFEYVDEDNSTIEYSYDPVEVTGGNVLGTFVVTINTEIVQFNQFEREVVLSSGDVLCISARMASPPASDVQASVSIIEDI